MAAQKFLAIIAGKISEVIASVTSNANALVAMDATGKLDVSVLPTGVGPEVKVCEASENLAAGDFINLFLSAGVIKAQKADATNAAKPAHGFVLADVLAAANATVFFVSNVNTAKTGLTIGSDYYLSTTPGLTTDTPPSASGNLLQPLGRATSATELPFMGGDPVQLA